MNLTEARHRLAAVADGAPFSPAALAAVLAELDTVQAELVTWRDRAEVAKDQLTEVTAERDRIRAEHDQLAVQLAQMTLSRDAQRARLDRIRKELDV